MLPALSIERELESAARYAASALAPATRRAYEYDWRVFAQWCVARGLAPMPAAPETIAAFLAAEADRDLRPVTITRRAAAIAAAHRSQGQSSPCESAAIAAVLSGIRRTRGIGPQRRAQALELEPLARMIELVDTGTLAGLRDRALLLLGFAAALRRSELVALDVEDLDFDAARGLWSPSGAPRPTRSRKARRSPSPTPRSAIAARSGRCAATSTPPPSTAARCSARCAAATTSPTAGTQTSRSR